VSCPLFTLGPLASCHKHKAVGVHRSETPHVWQQPPVNPLPMVSSNTSHWMASSQANVQKNSVSLEAWHTVSLTSVAPSQIGAHRTAEEGQVPPCAHASAAPAVRGMHDSLRSAGIQNRHGSHGSENSAQHHPSKGVVDELMSPVSSHVSVHHAPVSSPMQT